MANKSKTGLTSIKEKIIRGGFWVSSGFAINALAGLLIGILLSRILSTDDVGTFYLVFSIVTTASMLGQLGLNRTIVRFTANALAENEPGNASATATRMLSIIIIISAAFLILSLLPKAPEVYTDLFGESDIQDYIFIIGIWISFNILRIFLGELFRGTHNIKMAALTQRILVNLLFLAGLSYILIIYTASSVNIVFALVCVSTFLVATMAFANNIIWIKQTPNGKPQTYRNIINASFPLFISQSLLIISNQFPIWILGASHDQASVAIYSIASRTAFIVSLPLLIANNVTMPIVAGMFKTQKLDKLKELLSLSVIATSTIATLIALIFFFQGDHILNLLFGSDYSHGYLSLTILSAGLLFNVFAGSSAVLLAMSGNENKILVSIFISAVATITLSLIFIPLYGTNGAAMAYTIGLMIYNFLLAVKARETTGLKAYINYQAIRSLPVLIYKIRK